MLGQSKKIKIVENKSPEGPGSKFFNISYSKSGSEQQPTLDSYGIISCLKGDNNLIIEVNSTLLSLLQNQRESCVINFVKNVRNMGLDYRYRKIPQSGRHFSIASIFSMLTGSPADNHEVLVQIPDHSWKQDEIHKILPPYGVKYYICRDGIETANLLDLMYSGQLLEDEKFDYFKLIVFDCCSYEQMGAYTTSLTIDDIKKMLDCQ